MIKRAALFFSLPVLDGAKVRLLEGHDSPMSGIRQRPFPDYATTTNFQPATMANGVQPRAHETTHVDFPW
jgi:hypothetical protein